MVLYLSITLAFALMGIIVYGYFFQKGQFDDCEDVKYQLFREDDEE